MIIAGAIVLVGLIFVLGIFSWFAKDLPAPGKLSQKSGASTVFYDRDDKVLFELYKDRNRVPVTLSEVSGYMKKATIAIEDKNFYQHSGISQAGILRAVLSTIFKGSVQGGSTITQQLIKNVLLDSSRSYSRKIKEVILAVEVEKRYTKDQILEMYLNEAPYGGSYWGIGSAAQGYFGRDAKDLTILQSAILAGFPQRPSYFSPFIGKEDAWKGRTKDVLRRMREDGYITRREEEAALAQLDSVKFTTPKLSITAPHFIFYVRDLIEKEYGSEALEKGLKIKTTISRDIQKKTEAIVKEEVEKLKGFNAGNGAAVVVDSQSGEILAMVGSYDFRDEEFGAFNAALGLRQPGSALKPITYAAAFEKGYTPSTVLMDVKTSFKGASGQSDYVPGNYDGRFRGPIQVRFALGNSINVPAVKMLAMIGVKNFLQKAYDMGLETLAPTTANMSRFGLAITLGGGEVRLLDLTTAYSVLARGGTARGNQAILEIKDANSRTIFKAKKPAERKVLSAEASYLVSHILSDNNARSGVFGTSSYLNVPGRTVAVKTGTTDDKRDNWTIGYTKGATVGVWVGNNDNSPMNPQIASGVTGATPIWNRIMSEVLKNKEYEDGIPDRPGNVEALVIDAYLGGLPKDGYPTRSEFFMKGTAPADTSPYYKKLKLSKEGNKLANEVEVRSGNYTEKEFIVITEKDPLSIDGKNRWQEAIDEWARSQSDDKYKPPTDTSSANQDEIFVSIKEPAEKTTVDSNSVTIKVKITSGSPVKKARLLINGNEIKSYDGDRRDFEETVELAEGTYEIRAEAENEKGKKSDSTVKIGVKVAWDS